MNTNELVNQILFKSSTIDLHVYIHLREIMHTIFEKMHTCNYELICNPFHDAVNLVDS